MALNLESSMTDLMTSLAVVFIMLMLAVLQNQGQGSKNALNDIQTQLNEALKLEQLECKTDNQDPLSCVIRLPEDRLRFLVAKADVDPKGEQFIKRIFPKIIHILAKKAISPSVESFYIQGFTDSDGDDEHNLALSQQRAFSVGRFVVTDVIPPSAERNYLLKWLYVNGRGEQEQLLDTRTHQENKQASRRVEVRIRVKSNEQRNVIASAVKP